MQMRPVPSEAVPLVAVVRRQPGDLVELAGALGARDTASLTVVENNQPPPEGRASRWRNSQWYAAAP